VHVAVSMLSSASRPCNICSSPWKFREVILLAIMSLRL